jgi:hypothetical protein
MATVKRFPIMPAHPERVCWGCDKFCAAYDMRCGNCSDRTPHPVELFGEGWETWGGGADASCAGAVVSPDAAILAPIAHKM